MLWVLLTLLALAACSPGADQATATLPPGDATRGSALFTQTINGAPSCIGCHTLDGNTLQGPSLLGYGAVAATRVEGQSAEEYTRLSIVRPAAHVVSGFANNMYNQYEGRLSPAQIADLVAYLLTL